MEEPWNKDREEARRGLYVTYLEDFGRVGGRHETARAFYLSLITAIIGFLALAGPEGLFHAIKPKVVSAVAALGILISFAWLLQMWTFGSLFKAKKAAIWELEEKLIAKPFTKEEDVRKQGRYLRLTVVDRIVAFLFLLLFGALFLFGSVVI